MSSDSAHPGSYNPTYRQHDVDKTLEEFDSRISANERRWLMSKGAIAALAAVKGVDFALVQLGTLI